MVGHTHEDVDAGFSKIAENLKKKDAETIPELLKLIENVGPKYLSTELDKMLDVKSFLLPHLNEIKQISQPLHFKFVRGNCNVNVYAKSSQNGEWTVLENNILKSFPIEGKPQVLGRKLDKVNLENVEKVVFHNYAKNYFKQICSQNWWKGFIENAKGTETRFQVKWLESLPRQTDSSVPLPEYLQEMVDKETHKKAVSVKYRVVFFVPSCLHPQSLTQHLLCH